MKQVAIFLINLEASTDRLITMTARFQALDLSFERIPAVVGKLLTAEQRARLYPPMRRERELGDSEIGCYASHLKAMQIIVDRQIPRAIILEDDAQFDPDFAAWASPDLLLPGNADILKFERMQARSTKGIVVGMYAGRSIIFLAKPSFGAACYLVTLKGARKVIERCSVIETACDHQFFEYWKNGIVTYEVVPSPARQDNAESTLQHDRLPLDMVRRQKKTTLSYKITNWMPKNLTRLARYTFQIRHFGLKSFNRKRIPRWT